ncbi:MAG: glutathione S-transferase [Granulosicoccus sp.]|jgi:glutathione S-transferase
MTQIPTLYVTQGSGNSFKPMQVAAQLGLPCNVNYLNVLAGESRKPEFLSINPLGQLPYMVLDGGVGVGESNAIAWYLAEGSDLMPATALSRAQSIRWMNYEQTMLEANISPVRFFTFIVPELQKDHEAMIPIWRERGNQGLAVLNNYLEKNKFVTDHGYSVADIAVYGYTHLADEGGFELSQFKHITAWIARVQEQPGYLPIDQLLTGQKQSLAA